MQKIHIESDNQSLYTFSMSSQPSGTVTFLFTDIEGSTKLAQQYPDRWESLRARHHAILRSAMEMYNGYVFQIIGDAFCVAFHTASDALRAAIKSLTDFHSEDWKDTPIKVRIGIHTGNAQAVNASDQSGGYKGYTSMARVQRLMSAAHGGQALISLATEQLVRDDLPENISLRDMGERRLKDLIRPEHIYQLVISKLPADFPPIKTLDAYRNNLPIQLTSFIGREKEMAQIAQSISEHRLVTLTGVGGTGKTRLSLQVAADLAEQFTDGVWFVELASVSDPELIPQTILTTFGINEQPGRTVLQILTDYFLERNLLLILDNCEHIVQASAQLTDTLLNSSHSLRILATSREALGIKGEAIWHVPSLSLPDIKHLPSIENLTQYEAVRLFVERAILVRPDFAVTLDNAAFVAQVCSRLDGIPLAIELAASRVRALSVDQISKRLDDRFRLLTGGSRTALERHQTLRATIDWSYNLLSEEEKKLFRELAVFSGGWTLEAAESVCSQQGGAFDIVDLLTQLVDKSLVISYDSRYRMLETTRQYAREKLFDLYEGESTHEKHLAYFLDLAEQADKEIHGPDQIRWMDRLEAEHDNHHSALDWCVSGKKAESALRLLSALSWAWGWRDHDSEVERWFDTIRTLPEAADYPAPYAKLLNQRGENRRLAGKTRKAQVILQESRAIWLKLGVDGERGLAQALDYLGRVALSDKQDVQTAQSFFEESFELYQKHGDERGMAWAMHDLGNLVFFQGHYAEAEKLTMKSLAKFQELGDKASVAYVLNSLGELARLHDDHERAGRFYEQNLLIFRELRLRHALAYPFLGSGWVALHQGDYLRAKTFFMDGLQLSIESSNKPNTILSLAGFAGVLGMLGKSEQAARLFGVVESLLESISGLDPQDEKEIDHYTAVARAQLDQNTFAKCWAEGRALTIEQAIKYALEKTYE